MKKKLIMILCAVVSLSLAACGGTVETDSDSHSEREVEDEDDEDRDKDDKDEDKDKTDSGKSLFSKLKKSDSIIDEISLYEATLADIEGYLDEKSIIYDYSDNEIITQMSEDFMGYACEYVFNFQEILTIKDRYENVYGTLSSKEDYLQYNARINYDFVKNAYYFRKNFEGTGSFIVEEGLEDKSLLNRLGILVTCVNKEEHLECGKKITDYLNKKAEAIDSYDIYWDKEEDTTYYPINVIKGDGLEWVEYISLISADYEEDGYVHYVHVLEYTSIPQEAWYEQILDEEFVEPESTETQEEYDYIEEEVRLIEDYYARIQSNLDSYGVYSEEDCTFYYDNDGKLIKTLLNLDEYKMEFNFLRDEELYYIYAEIDSSPVKMYIDSNIIRVVMLDEVMDYNDPEYEEIFEEVEELLEEELDALSDMWDEIYEKWIKLSIQMENAFTPREGIDYKAISDKFAGYYKPENGGASSFEIYKCDEEILKKWKENGKGRDCDFMIQYREDMWYYSSIISYDGTTVELSFGENKEIVELTYIDENTVLYRGSKYIRSKEDEQSTETTSTKADSQTIENMDVDLEVKQIQKYYYTTQNNLGSYMLEEHQNLTMYHEAGYPVKIFVKSGYNDWDYTREYFYHDQELYFAFVYNNNEQHRLYFKDGIMIRYIDENGNTFDYGNLEAYSSWENKVKNEANGIYPTMPNCGA